MGKRKNLIGGFLFMPYRTKRAGVLRYCNSRRCLNGEKLANFRRRNENARGRGWGFWRGLSLQWVRDLTYFEMKSWVWNISSGRTMAKWKPREADRCRMQGLRRVVFTVDSERWNFEMAYLNEGRSMIACEIFNWPWNNTFDCAVYTT